MNYFTKTKLWLTALLLLSFAVAYPAMMPGEETDSKALDLSKHHNVGNAWLRVSNYGFFGSGSAQNRWPSLEYPGGSGIDYLFQGALWFGAQKIRRNVNNYEFYWRDWPPENNSDMITQWIIVDGVPVLHPEWKGIENHRIVIDTLVSIGFDGYWNIYELLPAWNPRNNTQPGYQENNRLDIIMETSTRIHRRGFDDDGDGLIDEDPIGRTFPLRRDLREDGLHLPQPFHEFTGRFIHELGARGTALIEDRYDIWFPLGFLDLGYTDNTFPLEKRFNFTEIHDDDHDFLRDEDGAPVSEQDYISYYYDYDPFTGPANGPINRVYGSGSNTHVPLNLRVRQMSFQWSYDFIKNLTYVEFNITNMNHRDTLFNCVMGIYMDCDTGPQSWDQDRRHNEDVSGYVAGINMEFAYTRNFNYPTVTPHWIGARVVNPNPEKIDYAAWVYSLSNPGPRDGRPWDYFPPSDGMKTANEKYWLLSGRNPRGDEFINMRERSLESSTMHWEQDRANDTRFLFAFFGDMNGYPPIGEPDATETEDSWNLRPFETMKIVVALFPGENLEDLKGSARWAKTIYGEAQELHQVVLPDTLVHYEPPEPPQFPLMFSELKEEPPGSNVINLDVFWHNRSEFSLDLIIVDRSQIGWQDTDPRLDSHVSNWDPTHPPQFSPDISTNWQIGASVNPYTAWRIRHSFQGYTLWGRSGRGDRESWMNQQMWDRIETPQDLLDFQVNFGVVDYEPDYIDRYINYGGDLGYDRGLPNRFNGENGIITIDDISLGGQFYGLDLEGVGHIYATQGEDFIPRPIQVGDIIYGLPIYNTVTAQQAQAIAHLPIPVPPFLTDQQKRENQLLFKHPDMREDIYLALVEDQLIPLRGHLGQNNVVRPEERSNRRTEEVGEEFLDRRYNRLARRYYHSKINNLPKGREYYVSTTAWSRGIPAQRLLALETGRDANMDIYFPGPLPEVNMRKVYVVPNPYRGGSSFDGSREGDPLGDRSRRLWFFNLPARANVQIYTLAGDLVDEFEHYPGKMHDVISISREVQEAIGSGGIHPWDLLSKNNQIIASGLYFFSVKNHDTGEVQVGKFAVIR